MAKNDHICISLSDETLKIVEVKGSAPSAKIAQCVAVTIAGMAEADVSTTIQKSLKGFNTKSASVVLMVPPSITTSKNIEIPSTDEEEIKSIVNLQATRHTPYTREEIQVGFVNIGIFKGSFTKVLLVIANRLQIKSQIDAIEKAGVKVKKVLFAPEAIAQFYGSSKQVKRQTGPVGVIDIAQNNSNFVIIANGKAVAYRNILIGRNQLASDSSAQDKLADELKLTVEAYEGEGIDQVPSSFIFSSDDDLTKGLQGFLKTKLDWNIGFFPYTAQAKAGRSILGKLSNEYASNSFLDVVATAATAATARINLIPEEVQLQKSIEEQGRAIFKTAMMALTLLILVASIFAVRMHFVNQRLSKLQTDYEDSRAKVEALETQSKKTKLIRGYLNSRMDSLDTIKELYKYVPKDVYLTRITMEESGQISVQGVSEIGSTVYNLNKKFKESNLFQNADVKSKKAKKDRGKDAHAFEIVLELDGVETMEKQ